MYAFFQSSYFVLCEKGGEDFSIPGFCLFKFILEKDEWKGKRQNNI